MLVGWHAKHKIPISSFVLRMPGRTWTDTSFLVWECYSEGCLGTHLQGIQSTPSSLVQMFSLCSRDLHLPNVSKHFPAVLHPRKPIS
jgi:hypothetical protein